jgi:hypothetical protein
LLVPSSTAKNASEEGEGVCLARATPPAPLLLLLLLLLLLPIRWEPLLRCEMCVGVLLVAAADDVLWGW